VVTWLSLGRVGPGRGLLVALVAGAQVVQLALERIRDGGGDHADNGLLVVLLASPSCPSQWDQS
jgi:hypothetical protein